MIVFITTAGKELVMGLASEVVNDLIDIYVRFTTALECLSKRDSTITCNCC